MQIANPRTVLTTLALALLAVPARADFNLNTQIDTSKSITATFAVPASGTEPGIQGNFYVGPLTGTANGQSFQMFCVNLFSDIQATDHYMVNAQGLSTLTTSPNFGPAPDTDLIARLLTVGTTNSKLEGAALQIAVWDATYNGGHAFTGGTLAPYVTNLSDGISQAALVAQVNTFLNAVGTYAGTVGTVTYLDPSGNYGQGMVTLATGLPIQSVPEPSALILAGIGIVGFVGVGFRRRMLNKPVA